MNTFITILVISLLQSNKIFGQLEYGKNEKMMIKIILSKIGNMFPIPLAAPNDDPNFKQCSEKNGVYAHTSNCSLFHLCTFGLHTIHSCIDGFFFNPTSRRCQYLPMVNDCYVLVLSKFISYS